jgi:hypothetical protein
VLDNQQGFGRVNLDDVLALPAPLALKFTEWKSGLARGASRGDEGRAIRSGRTATSSDGPIPVSGKSPIEGTRSHSLLSVANATHNEAATVRTAVVRTADRER